MFDSDRERLQYLNQTEKSARLFISKKVKKKKKKKKVRNHRIQSIARTIHCFIDQDAITWATEDSLIDINPEST